MKNKSELTEKQYPRVLILYGSRINKEDQHGLSLRSWFAEWPRESLAQVYSGGETGDAGFCGHMFKLGTKERRWGKLFFSLKNSSLGKSSSSVVLLSEQTINRNRSTKLSLMKHSVGQLLLKLGLWELLFKPRLSLELEAWVRNFRPDIIYCQGYNLTFSWLPILLQRRFSLPICFQTGDDWPRNRYRGTPMSWIIRPILRSAARRLVLSATVRLANGEAMAAEYLQRYGVSFTPLMMCDDIGRFRAAIPLRLTSDGVFSVVYTGSLGSERWQPLIEFCEIASSLQNEGISIMVTALATGVPPEAFNRLRNVANLQILSAPSHEVLPSYLKGADLLFLPESFDVQQAESIRFSISTKAHMYMMSERPTLVYASPVTGIMWYARSVEWGSLVDRQDHETLKDALRRIVNDVDYRRRLIERGLKVALERHDGTFVRDKFCRELCSAIKVLRT